MRTTYVDRATRTICDVSEVAPNRYEVNRVNTPRQHRGAGVASRLMREQVLPAADAEGVILQLWILPTGGLEFHELAAWYMRLGFSPRTEDDGILWVRYPREVASCA